MRQVTMRKTELAVILRKNRREHRDIFLAAQVKYREAVIKEIDLIQREARKGRPFRVDRLTRLVLPSDHTADYDRVLAMLELEVANTVVLQTEEFRNYVQDEWAWSRNWAASNSNYVASPKFAKYSGSEE